jgi:hypothetical protein
MGERDITEWNVSERHRSFQMTKLKGAEQLDDVEVVE